MGTLMYCLIVSWLMLTEVQSNPLPTQQVCSSEALVKELQKIVNEASPAMHYLGDIPAYAASSCTQLFELRPNATSSYYWIQKSSGAVRVYCRKDGTDFLEQGPWMRIASVNMSDPASKCPAGLDLHRVYSERLCRKTVDSGCSSAIFPTHEVPFKKICGRVIGGQYYSPDAFRPYYDRQSSTIDDQYVDGVSITYGRYPRQHIWTFAAALSELPEHNIHSCPCTNSRSFVAYTGVIPEFIGNDYYCETASRTRYQQRYYPEDPLWDGQGCGRFSTCCEGERKPWFCKELQEPASSDIEVRLCTSSARNEEDIYVSDIELYVQ